MIRRSDRAAEAILLAMACLSPRAFGAARDRAEAGLYLGVTLLALLRAVFGAAPARPRGPAAVPGLALAGLVVLAMAQSSSWPGWLVGRVAPLHCTRRLCSDGSAR